MAKYFYHAFSTLSLAFKAEIAATIIQRAPIVIIMFPLLHTFSRKSISFMPITIWKICIEFGRQMFM